MHDAAELAEPSALALAYAESLTVQPALLDWSDAMDTKLIAIFSVSSVIVTLVPTLGPAGLASSRLWLAALAAWGFAAYFCCAALMPRSLQVGPDPGKLLGDDWLSLSAPAFLRARLTYMAEAYNENVPVLVQKAGRIRRALLATAVAHRARLR